MPCPKSSRFVRVKYVKLFAFWILKLKSETAKVLKPYEGVKPKITNTGGVVLFLRGQKPLLIGLVVAQSSLPSLNHGIVCGIAIAEVKICCSILVNLLSIHSTFPHLLPERKLRSVHADQTEFVFTCSKHHI